MSGSPPALPARVYLLPPDRVTNSLPPLAAACYEMIRGLFAVQANTAHVSVADPAEAEFVLAAVQYGGFGPCCERLRRSRVYREYAHKFVLYCPDDNAFPAVRGLYTAASRRWVRAGWVGSAHYISSHIHRFGFTEDDLRLKTIPFSFVGSSRTHSVREKVLRLRYPGAVLIDSSPKSQSKYWWEQPNKEDYFATFRDVTRRSRFLICPRGISPASIRLYEAMEAATVPVIVADEFELPSGPDWDEFTVRVKEREVHTIPDIVSRLEGRAARMGAAARRAWIEYFSDPATIGSLVTWARALLKDPCRPPVALRVAEYANPRLLRAKFRNLLK